MADLPREICSAFRGVTSRDNPRHQPRETISHAESANIGVCPRINADNLDAQEHQEPLSQQNLELCELEFSDIHPTPAQEELFRTTSC